MAIYSGAATTGQRRAGVVALTIDGEAIDVASDCVYDPTTVTRSELLGQSGPQGFSETRKNGAIGFTVRDAANMTVANFMAMTDVSVVAVLANGKTVSGDNMWCLECSEVKTADGTFTVSLRGPRVDER
ncbi:phage tail tube protein [Roseomonas elaeocarpi]|uniref:Phage tail tube protein n=1 Tax=Roseomonas elaeocarpi TaxID=907779 RepID=A0ABV6JQC4_9PROT